MYLHIYFSNSPQEEFSTLDIADLDGQSVHFQKYLVSDNKATPCLDSSAMTIPSTKTIPSSKVIPSTKTIPSTKIILKKRNSAPCSSRKPDKSTNSSTYSGFIPITTTPKESESITASHNSAFSPLSPCQSPTQMENGAFAGVEDSILTELRWALNTIL